MVNKTILKGIITYKGIVRMTKVGPMIDFGLSFNSIEKTKQVHSIICSAKGRAAQVVDEDLSVKDVVIIVGFLTTMELDLKRKNVLNVETIEPTITKKNVYFRDMGVDTDLFDKYIDGFDIRK